MDYVRMAVLSADECICTFFDNLIPDAMHYKEACLHTYLQGSTYTLEIETNTVHEDMQYLVEGNKIAFVYKNRDYMLNIVKIERNETDITIMCWGMLLEMTNEIRDAYNSNGPMSLAQYLEYIDPEHILTLGINEVSDKSIANEWEGSQTVLARLYSIANIFDSEFEFRAELNDNYTLKQITLNAYRKHDDKHQGMGSNRTDQILRFGMTISTIRKTSDITELYTAIRVIGKDGANISGLDRKEYDEDGNLEYFTGVDMIYAPQARDRFPSNVNQGGDRYISHDWNYDSDSKEVLYGQGLAQLKKYSVPQVAYEIAGYYDANIGDTFTIEDDAYKPMLILSARVTEQEEYFVDPSRNKTTYSNVEELQSELDPNLVAAMQKLIEQNKVYTCNIATDNGIIFKNNTGNTTLTAQVKNGAVDVTENYIIQWNKDGNALSASTAITVSAADVVGKAVYKFIAYNSEGTQIGEYEVTVTNVDDGKAGAKGDNGDKGEKGDQGVTGSKGTDGKTYYTWIKYATSAAGANMSDDPTGKTYIGLAYNKTTATESTNASDYTWSLIQGPKGDKGNTGSQGPKGDKGDQGNTGAAGTNGQNAITGELSLSPIVLSANSSGAVSSYAGAQGTFKVFDGTTAVTSGVTYSLVSATGVTVSINSTTGAYAVSSMPNTTDYGTTMFKAVYKGTTIQKILAVIKAKQGTSGKGISSTAVTYQASSSGTTAPTGTWSTSIPSVSANQYLWTRTLTTYTDSTTTTAYSVGKMGSNGTSGIIPSATAPSNPTNGQLWQDTKNNVIKKWNGSAWVMWYMDVTNLNVENLSAISSTIGTIKNPYTTGIESEWSNEALKGEITIGGAGIKNEYTETASGRKGTWMLSPDSYLNLLYDTKGNVLTGISLTAEGLSIYSPTYGWTSLTADMLYNKDITNKLSPGTGVTVYETSICEVHNNRCYMSVLLVGEMPRGKTLLTIPTEYRPKKDLRVPCSGQANGANATQALVDIRPTGEVVVFGIGNSGTDAINWISIQANWSI